MFAHEKGPKVVALLLKMDVSGQIDRTHDQKNPKGSFLEGKSPAISKISRLVKYYNLVTCFVYLTFLHSSTG